MEHGAHDAGAGAALGLVPWLILAGIAATYLRGALAERRRGRAWSTGRIASFTAGVGLLAIATAPPVLSWAHQDLRGHMSQHLLLGMLAPLGLVLGAPLALLLRNLPVPSARRLSAVLRHDLAGRLTHPVTALVLDTGGLYLLYLTPLYSLVHTRPVLNGILHFHFLLAGVLFASSIAGPDPAPQRPRFRVRMAVLFVATAAHGTLAKAMYAHGWPRGAGHDPAEIRDAAQIMYYGGDFAELLLAITLFASWYRRSGRQIERAPAGARPSPGVA